MSKCFQCGKTMGGFDSVGLICSQCKTNNDLRDSVKGRGGTNSDDSGDWIPFIPVFIFFFSFIKYSNRLLTYYEIEINILIKIILYPVFVFIPMVILYDSVKLFLEKLFEGGEYLLYVYVLYLTYDLIKPWL